MKTLVAGASENVERYSNKAIRMLIDYGHEVYAQGLKKGNIGNTEIHTEFPDDNEKIDTVSLYLGPQNQEQIRTYIIQHPPRRVIFNPGTENAVLMDEFKKNGIEVTEACTLVLLRTNQY